MTYTAEKHRILRAAQYQRIWTNPAGRWVIEGDLRPNRKEREALFNGGFVDYMWDRDRRCGYKLTDKGRALLIEWDGATR